MASIYQRSLVKGVVWESISFVIATLGIYLFYGNFNTSIKFSFILTAIKVPLFFIHERVWKIVKWGKY